MSKKDQHSDFTNFRNYYLGKMSPKEKNDFEKNIEEDPFAKEALEGFLLIENDFERISVIENTNMKIKEHLGLETVSVFPIKSFMAIAASVVLLISSYFFISNNSFTENNLAENKAEIEITEEINDNNFYNNIEQDSSFIDSLEINKNTNFDEDVIITDIVSPTIKETSVKKKELKKIVPSKSPIEKDTKITFGSLDNEIEEKMEESITIVETQVTQDFAKTSSMNSIAIDKLEFDDNSIELEKISHYKKAVAAYNKGEHSKAIRLFNKSISDNKSVNSSNFYIGMSYFNQGKSTKAIKYFNKLMSTSFKEKAEWYKALALINKGKKNDAKKILESIATSNSSFRDSAMNKLLSL